MPYPTAMFTGIIEACVQVLALEPQGTGARLTLSRPDLPDWNPARGDSIAVAGACMTLVEEPQGPDGQPAMAFDLSHETLLCTHLGRLKPGRKVNLERAMRLGDRLDGHMVSGHVDATGKVVALEPMGDGGTEITFEVPESLERFLVDKGSITLDGISLTVVRPEGRRFRVALIPLTLEITSLSDAQPGDEIHMEADLVGKWIERLTR
ncbi:MAG: riboflavin synthase [Planctomycetota bacterium]|nr:riboflavin synthase [Planctomycetota bacterium]